MSLDSVVEDIREQARDQAAEIRDAADERANEIIDQAEDEAAKVIRDAEQEIERQIAREREQELSSANLEAKQRRLEARRDMLDEVRNAVEERLSSLEGSQREELTRALLDAAVGEIEERDDAVVYCRSEDADLLQSILEEYEGFSYAGDYDCLGGVVVESEASRLRVNNTFDSVLETVWDDSLRDISAQLFDSESEQ